MAGVPIDTDAFDDWFIRRGVPHFIVGYSARTDIWVRAVPILVLAYLGGGLNALDIHDRSLGWNVGAAALVLGVLGLTWALANRVRDRPVLAVPEQIGPIELLAFLVGPTIPAVLVGQAHDAVQAFIEGVAVLGVIYFATSYAVIPLGRWATRRALSQIVLFFNTVVRVLPLLLLAITFLFINAEVWQVAGRLAGPPYIVVVGLFVVFGVLFVLSRVPALISTLSTFGGWDEVASYLDGTPAAGLPAPASGALGVTELDRRERLNLGLVAVFSQALQITFVAVAVFAFFTLFGFLAIPPDTVAVWTGEPAHVLLGSGRLVVTEELLRVAGFLSTFTGMYFTVVLSTDATYREEFAEDVAPQIRQAIAVRAAYLHARRDATTGPDR